TGLIQGDLIAVYDHGGAADPNRLVNSGDILSSAEAAEFGSADDTVINSGFISGLINLGAGNDILDSHLGTLDGKVLGQSGNDTLIGGASNDFLSGGFGIDILTGNGGSDTFHFSAGGKYNNDTVTDFQHGIDTIELDHAYFTRLAAGDLDATEF